MQWNVQEVVKRIVNELQKNGYVTWFGARCMYSPRALALTIENVQALVFSACQSM